MSLNLPYLSAVQMYTIVLFTCRTTFLFSIFEGNAVSEMCLKFCHRVHYWQSLAWLCRTETFAL